MINKVKTKFVDGSGIELQRKPDWPTKLIEELGRAETKRFVWGKNDCCLLLCDCILAMTGVDIAVPEFRGKYKTKKKAYALIKKVGGDRGVEGVAEVIFARYGVTEVPVAYAQRGDCVLAEVEIPGGEQGPALGIVVGRHSAFMSGEGLIYIPIDQCSRAWRV